MGSQKDTEKNKKDVEQKPINEQNQTLIGNKRGRPAGMKIVTENATKSKRGRKCVVLSTYEEEAEKAIKKWKQEIVKQAKDEDQKQEN